MPRSDGGRPATIRCERVGCREIEQTGRVVPDKPSASRLGFPRFYHRGWPRNGTVAMAEGISLDDVEAAYEAVRDLEFAIRNLVWVANSKHPDQRDKPHPQRKESFETLVDYITVGFDMAREKVEPILPFIQGGVESRFGFKIWPSMHVAILNCADGLRRKASRPDSFSEATDGFIKFVASIPLPTPDVTDARLFNEKQGTQNVLRLTSSPRHHEELQPSQQFWDTASAAQKAMIRLLLDSPGYRVRRSVLEATDGCFRVDMPTVETFAKSINRLNDKLMTTANGWFVERSTNLKSAKAEVWLNLPSDE